MFNLSVHKVFIALSLSPFVFRPLYLEAKKTGTQYSVVGFTICCLIPVVTTWGYQFIASTRAAVQNGA
jgi:hypothetical protein